MVDLGMVVDLSVVVPKAADPAKAVRVDKEARAAKARTVTKRKKYTMGSRPLSLETRKIQEMDLKEMPQKAENPSTKVRESLETLTKPSDF